MFGNLVSLFTNIESTLMDYEIIARKAAAAAAVDVAVVDPTIWAIPLIIYATSTVLNHF